jgi:ABC-type branched-subunit amino acid transport system substrate-binding protein
MPFTNSWINGNKALCEELYFRTKEKKCNIIRALAFDAVMTLKSALEISKGDQNELKAGLGQVNYQGITGPIEFDSLGRIKTSE